MKLENAFEVPARPDEVWALLNDVSRVVPCMPGASLDEVVDEDTFKATMNVKLGPIGLQFATDIARTRDDAEKRVTLVTNALDNRGRGGARATIESSLSPTEAGTQVRIVTEMTLEGAVAQTGRAVVPDVVDMLTTRFAECLALQLGAGPVDDGVRGEAPKAKAISAFGVVRARLRRLLARGRPTG